MHTSFKIIIHSAFLHNIPEIGLILYIFQNCNNYFRGQILYSSFLGIRTYIQVRYLVGNHQVIFHHYSKPKVLAKGVIIVIVFCIQL